MDKLEDYLETLNSLEDRYNKILTMDLEKLVIKNMQNNIHELLSSVESLHLKLERHSVKLNEEIEKLETVLKQEVPDLKKQYPLVDEKDIFSELGLNYKSEEEVRERISNLQTETKDSEFKNAFERAGELLEKCSYLSKKINHYEESKKEEVLGKFLDRLLSESDYTHGAYMKIEYVKYDMTDGGQRNGYPLVGNHPIKYQENKTIIVPGIVAKLIDARIGRCYNYYETVPAVFMSHYDEDIEVSCKSFFTTYDRCNLDQKTEIINFEKELVDSELKKFTADELEQEITVRLNAYDQNGYLDVGITKKMKRKDYIKTGIFVLKDMGKCKVISQYEYKGPAYEDYEQKTDKKITFKKIKEAISRLKKKDKSEGGKKTR